MAQVWICSKCALGHCDECKGSSRSQRRCCCRHGRVLPRTDDPRGLGGAIVTTGGPNDEGTSLIDASRGLLVDDMSVARVDNPSDGRTVVALLLEGRVNRSADRASVLALLNGDGVAAIVTELMGLAARMGPDFELEFREALDRRLATADLWPTVAPNPS